MMIVSQKSRPDRIAAMYPVLFAGGAVWIEMLAHKHRLGWLKPVSVLSIVGIGLVLTAAGGTAAAAGCDRAVRGGDGGRAADRARRG